MTGKLFVISGPSGVGKDTLMALIFDRIPSLKRWITCTTRKPRKLEVDGIDYFFKSVDEFKQMLCNNELVEHNEFAGNLYGTPKKFVIDNLELGHNIATDIDVNGAINVKKNFPEAHLIFIEPPSMDELKSRLIKRGSDSDEQIQKRLSIVESELAKKASFEKIFVNDNLDKCCEDICNYILEHIK